LFRKLLPILLGGKFNFVNPATPAIIIFVKSLVVIYALRIAPDVTLSSYLIESLIRRLSVKNRKYLLSELCYSTGVENLSSWIQNHARQFVNEFQARTYIRRIYVHIERISLKKDWFITLIYRDMKRWEL